MNISGSFTSNKTQDEELTWVQIKSQCGIYESTDDPDDLIIVVGSVQLYTSKVFLDNVEPADVPTWKSRKFKKFQGELTFVISNDDDD